MIRMMLINEEEGEGEEEEEEVDPEIKRRMELRERMAKMSGGMGMHGMFGGGMPMPGMAQVRKKKPSGGSDKVVREEQSPVVAHAPPVPIMPILGTQVRSPEQVDRQLERDEEVESHVRSCSGSGPGGDGHTGEDVKQIRPRSRDDQIHGVPSIPSGRLLITNFQPKLRSD